MDGRVTAGYQSGRAKHNLQLPESHPLSQELGTRIIAALEKSPLFMGAALPLKVFPPLFNRYDGGQSFGAHVDNAVRQISGTSHRVRTDLSATLFLTPPEDYDGGELVIESAAVETIAPLSRSTARPDGLMPMRRQRSRHPHAIGLRRGNPWSVARLRNARCADRARGPG